MIEVNLLPGGKKRQDKKSGFSLSLPKVGGPSADKWMLGSALVILIALGYGGNLFFQVQGRLADLEQGVEAAIQDSVRYADLIQKTEILQARRDSIAQKVAIIQGIDAQRYVWAHLMDEVGRALPDYTWLTNIVQVSDGEPMQFRIEGRAGNNFALTRFWNSLESSLFIRNVRLISTEQTPEEVYQFILEAELEEPPSDVLMMEPLLGSSASLQASPAGAEPVNAGTAVAAEGSAAGVASSDRP